MPTSAHIEKGGYIETIGRRKTATARVRISKGKKQHMINGRKFEEYLNTKDLVNRALVPLELVKEPVSISVLVSGGGVTAQAEAIRLGLARALITLVPTSRTEVKSAGLLTRDARKKERKHPGFRKARRSPQWSKR